ncbi:PhoX family phosphatase [Nocardioides sp.]|uniref:PhoX family protein n=1 Tax=Nocardioides sp. TaxID=35761 RepID=UPI0027329589|nr:PhoX family phosphatase [Nocardioides sp.]MDP3891081.1 PhoX family phosphatase [Nocardioides sp.]
MTTYIDFDPDDTSTNPSQGPAFTEVVSRRSSRRAVLGGGMAVAAGFLTTELLGSAPASARTAPRRAAGLLGFDPVPLGHGDEVVVPAGYTARAIIPWGTPILGSFPEFRPGVNSAAEQEQQVGMHHDGMHFFPLSRGPQGSRHGLLVVNHEYTDEGYLHTGTPVVPPVSEWTAEMVRRSQAAHGVSVVEVRRDDGGDWSVVRSAYNRRLTATTRMSMSGPAAGHRLVRTAADPRGRGPLGTINNCSHGVTPWDTYLTCEENFNGYFRVDPGSYTDEQQQLLARYGVGGDRFRWATHDDRFVVRADDANEPNRFGWVVEIDPFDPQSRPVKRTALGRLKHESAYVHVGKAGRVVVYTGDDQVNEHVYKFVSDLSWRSARARGRSPLDEGTLYVARFDEDGSGEWLPLVHGRHGLTPENGFADQGEVLVKTRQAASVVGATRMDRPEWVSVDPNTGMVYLTLTNNTSSSKELSAANPRMPNPWGHIVRWKERDGDHTGTRFDWDLFLLAGQGRSSGDGSTVPDDAGFGSPDGIWSDPDGRVWIQTDGTQPAGANDQMLAANPYVTDGAGAPEIKRFLTGVVGCEVTGVVTTPDQRSMFVNLQHPGDGAVSRWPGLDGITVPRSATVVVTRDDGGVVGT